MIENMDMDSNTPTYVLGRLYLLDVNKVTLIIAMVLLICLTNLPLLIVFETF